MNSPGAWVEERLEIPGPGGEGRAARLALPDSAPAERPGVLVLPDSGADTDALRDPLRRLVTAGFAVLVPDAADGPAPDDAQAEWQAFARLSDRVELGHATAALAALGEHGQVDAQRTAVVGLGTGGTLAFLLGCTRPDVHALVDVAGRVVYPQLSAAKPVQPIELALNLGAPVLAIFGADDAATPAGERALLSERLAQFAVRLEMQVYEGVGHGFSNPSRPGYHGPSARDAWDRIVCFVQEELARL